MCVPDTCQRLFGPNTICTLRQTSMCVRVLIPRKLDRQIDACNSLELDAIDVSILEGKPICKLRVALQTRRNQCSHAHELYYICRLCLLNLS